MLMALELQHGDDRRRAHREFLAICALAVGVEPLRWHAACAAALARGEVSADGVKAALHGDPARETTPAPALPKQLLAVSVPAGDVSQYSQLLGVAG
jgi:hypothetical protein